MFSSSLYDYISNLSESKKLSPIISLGPSFIINEIMETCLNICGNTLLKNTSPK